MKENLPGIGITSGPCLNCKQTKSKLKNGYCKDCQKRFGLGTRKQALHELDKRSESICSGTKKDGSPCQSTVQDGEEYCHWHKPDDE